jgi:hypothetical protein
MEHAPSCCKRLSWRRDACPGRRWNRQSVARPGQRKALSNATNAGMSLFSAIRRSINGSGAEHRCVVQDSTLVGAAPCGAGPHHLTRACGAVQRPVLAWRAAISGRHRTQQAALPEAAALLGGHRPCPHARRTHWTGARPDPRYSRPVAWPATLRPKRRGAQVPLPRSA